MNRPILTIFALLLVQVAQQAGAHHVLGRPAYSLNEDSNTPPSLQVETQIGDYFVTYMAFPAFPKPNEQGRVNIYATRIDDGTPYQGEVTFTVRDDSWFGSQEEFLGTQPPDDNVYRQGFIFRDEGSYIITAKFVANNEPYIIDFPLRIGNPMPVGPIGITVGLIALVLVLVNVVQRKRLIRSKIRRAHEEAQL
ncbi:MAG TPA: hypothetical protein EYH06_13965 [Chromatiales bacterium]|nr:hypothetical protein [Chromatiales bacterium]